MLESSSTEYCSLGSQRRAQSSGAVRVSISRPPAASSGRTKLQVHCPISFLPAKRQRTCLRLQPSPSQSSAQPTLRSTASKRRCSTSEKIESYGNKRSTQP